MAINHSTNDYKGPPSYSSYGFQMKHNTNWSIFWSSVMMLCPTTTASPSWKRPWTRYLEARSARTSLTSSRTSSTCWCTTTGRGSIVWLPRSLREVFDRVAWWNLQFLNLATGSRCLQIMKITSAVRRKLTPSTRSVSWNKTSTFCSFAVLPRMHFPVNC